MAIDRVALLGCTACPRLAAFLADARARDPDYHARPVPPWGDPAARVLYVGLAPGYEGANRTGKPFSGDVSGEWVYGALAARGQAASPEPGSELAGAAITNAVKCCPPLNRPTAAEVRTCREKWLRAEVCGSPARVIVAFGSVAFRSVLALARQRVPFAHGAEVDVEIGGEPRVLLGCYHPSPLNTRTGRMSRGMFDAVLDRAADLC
ncbi:MAG: uracil-DNA glycosylase family protein [Myxococcota bacterium]